MAGAKGGDVAQKARGRKKKSERKGYCFGILPAIIHPEAMQENPRLCSAMTVTSWCQMAFVVYLLTLHDPPATETWRPLVEFVVFMFATMLLIPAVKSVARAFGASSFARRSGRLGGCSPQPSSLSSLSLARSLALLRAAAARRVFRVCVPSTLAHPIFRARPLPAPRR